jgi:hypothetical protein
MLPRNIARGHRTRGRLGRGHAALTAGRGALALTFITVTLAGCGAVQVQPSTPNGSTTLASRGRIDSPLTDVRNHLGCLRQAHLAVQVASPIRLQIDALPAGPTVVFTQTPGAAQHEQIDGDAQSAEVIGSALLYPNQGSAAELASIEACLSQGVQG